MKNVSQLQKLLNEIYYIRMFFYNIHWLVKKQFYKVAIKTGIEVIIGIGSLMRSTKGGKTYKWALIKASLKFDFFYALSTSFGLTLSKDYSSMASCSQRITNIKSYLFSRKKDKWSCIFLGMKNKCYAKS